MLYRCASSSKSKASSFLIRARNSSKELQFKALSPRALFFILQISLTIQFSGSSYSSEYISHDGKVYSSYVIVTSSWNDEITISKPFPFTSTVFLYHI